MNPIDRGDLRRALSCFLTGVTVVTTTDRDGAPRGITANSFTSVSLTPPLVLVCVDESAASYAAFEGSRGFAVHILGAEQRELAATFASKSPAKFAGLACRNGLGGAPVLPVSAAWLDCVTERRLVIGDHLVVVGEVRDFGMGAHRPLGFHLGRYVDLMPEQRLAGHELTALWIAETGDGRIVLDHNGRDWTLPQTRLTGELSDASLSAAASETLKAPAEIAFLYAVYDEGDSLRLAYRIRVSGHPKAFLPEDLPWDRLADEVRPMLRRYAAERQGENFGLYAGSSQSGRVATIGGIS